jgi:hypothetical protein
MQAKLRDLRGEPVHTLAQLPQLLQGRFRKYRRACLGQLALHGSGSDSQLFGFLFESPFHEALRRAFKVFDPLGLPMPERLIQPGSLVANVPGSFPVPPLLETPSLHPKRIGSLRRGRFFSPKLLHQAQADQTGADEATPFHVRLLSAFDALAGSLPIMTNRGDSSSAASIFKGARRGLRKEARDVSLSLE